MNGHINQKLQCEELERRELLSGNPWNGDSLREAPPEEDGSSAAERSGPAPAAQESMLPGSNMTADLQDPNGAASGRATYQSTQSSQVRSAVFRVTIDGAAENSSFDVIVDGSVVGQLTTDANGSGTFVLSSREDSSEQGPQEPSSQQPPAVHPGSTISVGPLSGTFTSDDSDN